MIKINSSHLKSFKLILLTILILLSLNVLFELRIIPSPSMLPTIQLNEIVLVDKVFYHLTGINRGDIILFSPPKATLTDEEWVKRVVGLPGETIEIKNGKIFINSKELTENYQTITPKYNLEPYKIPLDSFYVLGDNRNNSIDSHLWGPLKRKSILGRLIFGIWPNFGFLN